MTKTAAEFMAELAMNEKFQTEKIEREKNLKARQAFYKDDQKELIKELNDAGFNVSSVWDFVNSENNYLYAVPILKKHLSVNHHPKISAGILRSLAIPDLAKDEELWRKVFEIYTTSKSDKEIDIPYDRGLQQAAAVALSVLVTRERAKILQNIFIERPDIDGRMIIEEEIDKLSN